MGLVGKFVSRAWNGIKNGIGTAGKLIRSGANKAWNFVKDNQDTLGKIAGTAIGAGLNLYTGGAAAPFISGANNFIQGLPDNAFTKHLKNIAKASVFDYSTNVFLITLQTLYRKMQRESLNKQMHQQSIKLLVCRTL